MNIFDKARQLEGTIARSMAGAAKTFVRGDGAREPIEVVHAIVDAVEREVQSGDRGSRVFPFNTVNVSIAVPSQHLRAKLETVVNGSVTLRDRIVERLRAAGCAATDLEVAVHYVPRPQKHWIDPQFTVGFSRVDRKPVQPSTPPAEPPPGRLDMTIVQGTAEHRSYAFTARRIDLGRGSDVRDSRHGLIRTNDVVFADGSDQVNRSVSRRHAHIEHDPRSGEFRVHDDGSVQGTKIVRKGKTLPVPFAARGVRLQTGDEIVLGEARVRIKLDSGPRSRSVRL
jgi:hypothetical protein